jgi:hypothetical protein
MCTLADRVFRSFPGMPSHVAVGGQCLRLLTKSNSDITTASAEVVLVAPCLGPAENGPAAEKFLPAATSSLFFTDPK